MSKSSSADFEEEWTKIDNGVLELKLYYIPFATSQRVDISKVQKIKIISQAKSFMNQWGTPDMITWWSWDIKRNRRTDAENYYNVRIDAGGWLMKGFTVNDIHGFLTAMRKYLKVPDIEFVEGEER